MTTYAEYPSADAHWSSASSGLDPLGSGVFYAGRDGTPIYGAIFRWENTGIPQGATITSCSLAYTKFAAGAGVPDVRIHFEAADNPAYPTDRADASGRAVSTAYASIVVQPTNGRNNTPSLASALQEIVNRAGFAGTFHMHWRNANASVVSGALIGGRTIEHTGTADDPYLTVEYEEPSGGSSLV